MFDTDGGTTGSITRRRVLGGVAAGVTGVGAVTLGTREATAQADVSGDFEATGDEATLSQAPAALRVAATGEWAVETTGPLQQVRVTLQVGYDGSVAELAESIVFESTSGTYDLEGDALAEHDELTTGDLMPASAGETKTTDLRVRVVVSAVRDGSIIAEDSVEDTATVTIDEDGVRVTVGGSGTVTIDPAGGD